MYKIVATAVICVGLVLTACSSDTSVPAPSIETTTTKAIPAASTVASIVAMDRPAVVVVPGNYDSTIASPLIVVLHGYTGSGASVRQFFGLQEQAENNGFVAVYPDGTQDAGGKPFWNATDACCNFSRAPVDDSAYLLALVEAAKTAYNIDPKRVFFAGHSNGGFMSYRMACDHASTIAAIVSMAGATVSDPAQCHPTEPVSVLQIHGDADDTIIYAGGSIGPNTYPGAEKGTETWAGYNQCQTSAPTVPPRELDLDVALDGNDTNAVAYSDCPTDGRVELWTIRGGSHSPRFSETFASAVIEFLQTHPKV
jgi:polyhydroxybutyrate depolymerase